MCEGEQVQDHVGEQAVRAWLIIAAVFVGTAVVGLLGDWEGITRSAIIAGSIALFAGATEIAFGIVRVVAKK